MPNYSALSQYQNANFPTEMADVRGFEVRTRDGDDKVGTVEERKQHHGHPQQLEG